MDPKDLDGTLSFDTVYYWHTQMIEYKNVKYVPLLHELDE